jgi:uncharacterized membrane protein HdeD (DUF308 family)
MDMNKEIINSPTNSLSILSLVLGILTILSFCTGLIPFPFTGFICFPTSFLFGILALVFGVISLNQIRRQNESGRPMAWIGIMLGGFVFLCVMCMIITIASFFILSPNSIPTPPFIHNFST